MEENNNNIQNVEQPVTPVEPVQQEVQPVVQNNEPVTLNVKPPKKSKKGLIITIIILVLLAVGGLTTWLIISNNNSDSDEPDTEEKENKKDKEEQKEEEQKEEEKDDIEEKENDEPVIEDDNNYDSGFDNLPFVSLKIKDSNGNELYSKNIREQGGNYYGVIYKLDENNNKYIPLFDNKSKYRFFINDDSVTVYYENLTMKNPDLKINLYSYDYDGNLLYSGIDFDDYDVTNNYFIGSKNGNISIYNPRGKELLNISSQVDNAYTYVGGSYVGNRNGYSGIIFGFANKSLSQDDNNYLKVYHYDYENNSLILETTTNYNPVAWQGIIYIK